MKVYGGLGGIAMKESSEVLVSVKPEIEAFKKASHRIESSLECNETIALSVIL